MKALIEKMTDEKFLNGFILWREGDIMLFYIEYDSPYIDTP